MTYVFVFFAHAIVLISPLSHLLFYAHLQTYTIHYTHYIPQLYTNFNNINSAHIKAVVVETVETVEEEKMIFQQ